MYQLNDDGSFRITNYQSGAAFSSFLPGIAGKNGLPLWAFYVNRGQGIASFGMRDKNNAIMEFFPADKSYQTVYTSGFRTFLKIKRKHESFYVEPFSAGGVSKDYITETMTVCENRLELMYLNSEAGISVTVCYFILPEAPLGALVRHVQFQNVSSEEMTVEVLDGLPAILPAGVANAPYKELGNTLKSWFDVTNRDKKVPFYTLRGSMEDTAEVKEVSEGHFYVSFVAEKREEKQLDPIVDRDAVFSTDTSLQSPVNFIKGGIGLVRKQQQYTTNKVSCGFSPFQSTLEPGDNVELFTVMGYSTDLSVVHSYAEKHMNRHNLLKMKRQADDLTARLTGTMTSATGNRYFDAYSRQCFLDNGLRGGFPVIFENKKGRKVFYLYSRKHGDLERDYNFFSLSPTFYSQGNGNYRDINQNRRCDIYFQPDVYDENIKQFMNYIQLDGYNPLVVKGVRFKVRDPESLDLSGYIKEKDREAVRHFLRNSYTPGELKHFVERNGIKLLAGFESFLTDVLIESEELYQAEFGEGYWIDHWTYNLDLIDSFLAVYPDRQSDLFFSCQYAYFNSPARLKPRHQKYVVHNERHRQYNAVEVDDNIQNSQLQDETGQWVKTSFGDGEIYRTTLYAKLFMLAVIKTATTAPYGLGIEMEAGKPGWNDSLNGLPGMSGASTSELFELDRLISLLQSVTLEDDVFIPEEAGCLLDGMLDVIQSESLTDITYWDKLSTLREAYRERIYKGISGKESRLKPEDISGRLEAFKNHVMQCISKISEDGPLVPTYYYFERESGQKPVPVAVTPYLEGVVKSLKLSSSLEEAKEIYEAVKSSPLYDTKLKMYKTSMSIEDEPFELGRAKSFTPGWLENESVFLHMSYKYLLEILRSGLTEHFYGDMKNMLIPFLDPEVYGRSILENSSFIASSANPDPTLHGRGFVSRLSGSTIEFIHMWIVMMAGEKPFGTEGDDLFFQLSPSLADWMFTQDNTVSFTLFGGCKVTYVNPLRRSTFGKDGVSVKRYEFIDKNGREFEVASDKIIGRYAEAVRHGEINIMNVYLK